jgi:hypothetical protein
LKCKDNRSAKIAFFCILKKTFYKKCKKTLRLGLWLKRSVFLWCILKQIMARPRKRGQAIRDKHFLHSLSQAHRLPKAMQKMLPAAILRAQNTKSSPF